MRILCHVGPWCKEQFEVIARSFCPAAEIKLVSGFRNLDQTGMVDAYYNSVSGVYRKPPAPCERDLEVIRRCRLLRSLDADEARHHVMPMRRAIRDMLLVFKPDVLLSESIDQFLHDLLFQEAQALGISTYGLIRSFTNGYFRISSRGEFVFSRQPTESEVEACLQRLIDQTYIPSNLVPLKKDPLWTYLRIMLGNQARVIYFFARRYLSLEYLNYHYWSSSRVTRQMYLHFLPYPPLGDRDWQQRITEKARPVIFVPLQHFPEATIDYWTEDIEYVDYPSRLIELLGKLSRDFDILVKEHPGVWGYRKPVFYDRLKRIESVTFCPTNTLAQDCIASSDAVLVWTGSVGFEAALRGKPVLAICNPYYAAGPRIMRISLDTNLGAISDFIVYCKKSPITRDEQLMLVRHLLSGLFPGRFQNDGTFSSASIRDVEDARNIGETLRRFHDRVAINGTETGTPATTTLI